MTNPLTEQELAACKTAFFATPISQFQELNHMNGFAAALDYLRAELAKEEPSAWVCTHPTGFNGKPYIGRPYRTKEEADAQEGGFTVKPLYLRPSEPSQELTDIKAELATLQDQLKNGITWDAKNNLYVLVWTSKQLAEASQWAASLSLKLDTLSRT